MPGWMFAVVVLVIVLVSGWRLTYLAARLDRLHARVEGSASSLDAQLVRRADVALELGGSGMLDAASSFLLLSAASASLECAEFAGVVDEVQELGIPHHRAEVESEFTDALEAVAREWSPDGPVEVELQRRLVDACVRVDLAVRFHNEAVRDVRRVRSRAVVRLFHLAGHTVLPREVEFDHHVPALEAGAITW